MSEITRRQILQRRRHALSGQGILNAIGAVADEADKRCKPEMFERFWNPGFRGPNEYYTFIRDCACALSLNEAPVYHPHEPISGYNQQHHFPKKRVEALLEKMIITNQEKVDQIDDEVEVLLVSYHIWYNTASSRYYFDSDVVQGIYQWYLRMRGMRETEEVEAEIRGILKPHQISPEERPIVILEPSPRDVFAYQERIWLQLQRPIGGVHVDLLWAFGVYTTWPDLLGYVLFNQPTKERRKMLGLE